MKRTTLALAFSVTLSSPAWCSNYNLGTLSPTTTQTVALVPGPTTSTTFEDIFNFTIGGAVDSDLTVEFQGNPNAGTTFDSMIFTLYASDTSYIAGWNGFDSTFHQSMSFLGPLNSFSPGDYYLVTDGQFSSNTEFPGSYTMTFTTAVPEPEVYAMLSVGLGLMGWVGRRKKLQTA